MLLYIDDGQKKIATREQYRSRYAELEPQMQMLQREIQELSVEIQAAGVPDYKEKLTVLQYTLERYTNIDEGQDVPESVIEAFVVKIVVSKDGFDWYLRFDGDPDKPLHCTLKGKRKTTTKIMVSWENSPAMDSSPTGCYQGLILTEIATTSHGLFGHGRLFASREAQCNIHFALLTILVLSCILKLYIYVYFAI